MVACGCPRLGGFKFVLSQASDHTGTCARLVGWLKIEDQSACLVLVFLLEPRSQKSIPTDGTRYRRCCINSNSMFDGKNPKEKVVCILDSTRFVI